MSTAHSSPTGRLALGARLSLLAGAALLALAPAVAHAQAAGPVAAGGSRTDIGVSVQGTYDSNVSRSSASLADARGIAQDDYIVTPSINFDLARPVGRQSVFLTGSVGYDFYARDHILDREQVDISGGAALQAGGCHATVMADYARRQSQLQDLEFTGVLENLEIDQLYRVSADCARPIGFSPTGSVSESITNNSQFLQKSADHRTFTGTAGLLYSNPGLGQLQVFGEYDKTDYTDNIIVFDGLGFLGPAQGYKAYSGGVSYTRNVGSRLNLTAQVSYMDLRPDMAGEPGFDGLTYKLNGTLQLGSRLKVSGDFERGAIPANRIGVSYARNESEQVSLSYAATTRVTLGLGGFVQENRYVGSPLNLDPTLFVTHDRVSGLFASAGLKLGQKTSLVLDCRWEQQTADIAAFSYDDLRVSLTASVKF